MSGKNIYSKEINYILNRNGIGYSKNLLAYAVALEKTINKIKKENQR